MFPIEISELLGDRELRLLSRYLTILDVWIWRYSMSHTHTITKGCNKGNGYAIS